MEKVLITGGTGTIGKALIRRLLQQHYSVHVVSRSPSPEIPGVRFFKWDLSTGYVDPAALEGVDHIIHLAGAGVADQRWTASRKKEIRDSRVQGGQLWVDVLSRMPNQVKTVVSASAIGWYAETPPEPDGAKIFRKEEESADDSFLGNTCRDWEASVSGLEALGKRLVILRTGIVLSADGGAYVEFVKPIRMGLAAILGSGKQYISWIHIEDMVNLYVFALQNQTISGVYNAVAPKPVTNEALTLAIAKALKGRYYIPMHVPAFVLRLVMGEMSVEVLKSVQVSADKIRKAGFDFRYPSIQTRYTQQGFMDLDH